MTNQLLKKKLKGLWKMIFLIALMGSGFSGYSQDYFYVPNENDSLQVLLETMDPDNASQPKYYRNGDIIVLTDPGPYIFTSTLDIFAGVTIMGDPALAKRPEIWFYDNGFRPKEDSISLTFKNLKAVGIEPADSAATSGQSMASAFLRFDQAGYRNYDHITIENVEVSSFKQIVQLWKNQYQSHYKSLTIKGSKFNDIIGDNAIDPRKNPVDQITIVNNTFTNIEHGFLGEMYWQNLDEANQQERYEQHVLIDHNSFFHVTGSGGKSFIQNNNGSDGSVSLVFSNNIVSTMWWEDNGRPFRINELAGTFEFKNSVFHDFMATDVNNASNPNFNLDSVAKQDNVTLTDVNTNADYPMFGDTATYENPSLLLPSNSPLQSYGTDGGPIGDPRWTGSMRVAEGGLEAFIENTAMWNPGDIIYVTADEIIKGTVDIFQEITIMGDPKLGRKPELRFYDNGFRPKEDSISITIKGLKLNGLKEDGTSNAPFALRFDQASWYNYETITVADCEIYNFNGGIQLWKNQRKWYDKVIVDNVYAHDLLGDFFLDPRLNVVKELHITNSTFDNIKGFVKNLYNDNDAENEWGPQAQHVVIDHNTFFNVVSDVFIQQNDGHDQSITLEFTNNIVSTLLENTNSRPFRIADDVGTVTISHSVFHDFESSREEGIYNLDAVGAQANVTVTDITSDYPNFKDTTAADGYSYLLPSDSPLQTAGTDGGRIGDPRWAGSTKMVEMGLEAFLADINLWNPGDTIIVKNDEMIKGTIDIYQELVLMGDPMREDKPVLRFLDNGFGLKEDSINVTFMNLVFDGTKEDGGSANYIIRFDRGSQWQNWKQIAFMDVEAHNFRGGIQLYKNKNTMYESIILDKVYFHNMLADFVIDPRLNAVKELKVTNSTFHDIKGFLKNAYNNNDGDNVFGAVGQNFLIDHNTFYNVVTDVFIQQNDGHDQSVALTFSNNIVSKLAEQTNTRPFRIAEDAGTFTFSNSIFHDFESSREEGKYNLDSTALQSNVTVDGILDVKPEFKDPENGDFQLSQKSAGAISDGDGGYIGDPRWAPSGDPLSGAGVHPIPNDTDSLEHFMETLDPVTGRPLYWDAGDTILLVSAGTYIVNGTIDIYQEVTILGDPNLSVPPTLRTFDNGFGVKADTISITMKGFNMNGLKEDNESISNYILRFDRGAGWQNWNNIVIEDMEAYNFNGGIQLYKNKNTMYESVVLNRVYFHDMMGDFVLDPRLNAIKDLTITNSTFHTIKGFLKNAYNNNDGDNVFGTVAQNMTIDHNTFYNIISDVFIQQNDGHDNSVTLEFTNNIVSTLIDTVNTRPFRIAADAGTFAFTNSLFHAFESNRDNGKHNLDSAALQSNVTISDIYTMDPMFAKVDTTPYNFTLPLDTDLLSAGTDGGLIGDPRWYPTVGVTITPLTEIVTEGDEFQMEAIAAFGDGNDGVTWSVIDAFNGTSGDGEITSEGIFTAVVAGDVAVVAVSDFAPDYSDTLIVTIEPYIYVEEISLVSKNANGTETNSITSKGGSLIITATITPFAAPDKTLTWSLSDDSMATLATLNETSVQITAGATGTVTVTATANDGSEVTGTIDITMTNQRPVTAISVASESGATEVIKGETLQMVATVEPSDADNSTVAWSVDKANVATITEAGLLTAVAPGDVIVTASATDNSFKSGNVTITVTEILSADGLEIFTVYPNPTSDYLNIAGISKAQVEVVGLSGVVMYSKEVNDSAQIDLTSLSQGVYLLRVITSEEVKVIRFTKE